MRNLLALFALLLLTFVGVGYWRTWYSVEGQPTPDRLKLVVEALEERDAIAAAAAQRRPLRARAIV